MIANNSRYQFISCWAIFSYSHKKF